MTSEPLGRRRFLRRSLLAGATLVLAHQYGVFGTVGRWLDPRRSAVGAVHCPDYTDTLLERAVPRLLEAAGLPAASGRTVVLKPNFVDHFEGRPVETDARLILAVARHLGRLGAREVVVAEGPGNRNDLAPVLEASGLAAGLRRDNLRFVDLNYDDLDGLKTETLSDMATPSLLPRLSLPRTLTRAGLVVSMPKLKTHHHVGVTLSLKNLFGCVPGAKYGWPKNVLHWNVIERSILEIYGTLRREVPMFALVDGIVAMEGDGPLEGRPRQVGLLLAGEDLAAVDATAARVAGLDPSGIAHLAAAELLGLGRIAARHVSLSGDPLPPLSPFAVPEKFKHLVAVGQ
ncbi:MAG: DUF362 domain-containing protein [Candidatus Riflebacteria bacterium]|nr:DUF362 domain-containing protein [Candidatus Riflebacteria bacterium]